jgi:hypothetical protein
MRTSLDWVAAMRGKRSWGMTGLPQLSSRAKIGPLNALVSSSALSSAVAQVPHRYGAEQQPGLRLGQVPRLEPCEVLEHGPADLGSELVDESERWRIADLVQAA